MRGGIEREPMRVFPIPSVCRRPRARTVASDRDHTTTCQSFAIVGPGRRSAGALVDGAAVQNSAAVQNVGKAKTIKEKHAGNHTSVVEVIAFWRTRAARGFRSYLRPVAPDHDGRHDWDHFVDGDTPIIGF